MSRPMVRRSSPLVLLMLVAFPFSYRTAFSQESLSPCPAQPVKAERGIKLREESRHSAIKASPESNFKQPKLNVSVSLARRHKCEMSLAQPISLDNRTA